MFDKDGFIEYLRDNFTFESETWRIIIKAVNQVNNLVKNDALTIDGLVKFLLIIIDDLDESEVYQFIK